MRDGQTVTTLQESNQSSGRLRVRLSDAREVLRPRPIEARDRITFDPDGQHVGVGERSRLSWQSVSKQQEQCCGNGRGDTRRTFANSGRAEKAQTIQNTLF